MSLFASVVLYHYCFWKILGKLSTDIPASIWLWGN